MSNIIGDIIEIIKNETGFIITQYNQTELLTVISNRIKHYNLTEDTYLDFIKTNHSEVIYVVSCFTVHETSFYRHKNHFDRLRFDIIPELVRKNSIFKKINFISAGCSTGEEPYTIAMLLYEVIPDIENWNIQILATDINIEAIEKARNGEYTEYKLRNIDQVYIEKYFSKSSEFRQTVYTIKDKIKKMVVFKQINLNNKFFELPLIQDTDVIFCENVIIYFNKENIQRLINNFYTLLRDGGYLFLGYSETLNMIEHSFELSWWNDSFAYKKSDYIIDKEYNNSIQMNNKEPIKEIINSNNILLEENITTEDTINEIITNFADIVMDVPEIIINAKKNAVDDKELYYLIKSEALLLKNNFFESSDIARKALNINSMSIDAHLLLARNYMELDMPDFAEFEIKTAIYINSESSVAHYLYGQLYKNAGNIEKYNYSMQNICQRYYENRNVLNSRVYPLSKIERNTMIDLINEFIKNLNFVK